MPGAYDEGLNADEIKALNGHLTGDEVPPPDEQEGASEEAVATPAPSPAPTPTPTPAATPTPTPAATDTTDAGKPDGQQQPQQTEDEKFAAFMEQHKGKSPEEIARLAYQQSQRAERTGFQQRQTQQQLEAFQQRVAAAAQRVQTVKESAQQRRAAFDEKLNSDPDGAAKEIHERLLTAEEQEAEEAERKARVDAAFGLASAAIPDFDRQAPEVYAFGGEMGYSREELAGISDGRDLVVLSLARYAGNLIKAGLMDPSGKLNMPQQQAVTATDPRLTAPDPVQTLSSVPARSAGGGKTIDQTASDILAMSDADFAKLPPGELEAVLAQLQAAA